MALTPGSLYKPPFEDRGLAKPGGAEILYEWVLRTIGTDDLNKEIRRRIFNGAATPALGDAVPRARQYLAANNHPGVAALIPDYDRGAKGPWKTFEAAAGFAEIKRELQQAAGVPQVLPQPQSQLDPTHPAAALLAVTAVRESGPSEQSMGQLPENQPAGSAWAHDPQVQPQSQLPSTPGTASTASDASEMEIDFDLFEEITAGLFLKVRNFSTVEEQLDTLQKISHLQHKLSRLQEFVLGHSNETFEQLEQDIPFIRSVTSSRPDVPDARDATIVGLNKLVCTMLNRLSRVPWPEAQHEEPRTEVPIDVLIVVCSPGCAPLPKAFDEAHALAGIARRAGRTAHVLDRGGAAAINALLRQERSPRIVWFIGHGDATHPTNQRTLALTAEDGSVEYMLPKTLANIFGGASPRLELVVLNGCQSAASDEGPHSLCEAISRGYGVPTVGWRTIAADTAAQIFAIGLMGCLAPQLAREPALSRSAVAQAFEAGKRAVEAASRPRTAADDRTDAWAIADPAEGKQLPGGAWAAGVPVLLAPLPPALLDGVPPIPEQYERRPALEAAHRAALLRSEGVMAITAATTGISGAAGAGKSTTAAVLARDPLVHAQFPDGVTWLAFGCERKGEDVLRALARRLGVSMEAAVQLDGTELTSAVGLKLAGQRRLLVLDDIWTREQLRPFAALTAEGGRLGKLVTTRSNELAGEHSVAVASLKEEEGLRVLAGYMGRAAEELRGEAAARLAGYMGRAAEELWGSPTDERRWRAPWATRWRVPTDVSEEEELWGSPTDERRWRAPRATRWRAPTDVSEAAAARRLVALCCGNPAMLRSVAALCKKKGVAPTLAYLEQCRQKMRHAKLPDAGEQYGTLFDALAGSLDHLEPELAERCAMLATFPEDTDVPWSVVGQLWGTEELDTEEALTELESWHLIDVDWRRHTVSLIDLHLDYLRARAKNDLARWHAALLRGCGRRKLGSNEDREDDSYWRVPVNVLHHLTGSGEELAMQGGCEQVQQLRLQSSGVKAQQLKEVLPFFTRLKTLDLSANKLGAADASAIASVLETTQISSLKLEGNNLGYEGAVALAEGLKGNSTLQVLDLGNNELCGVTSSGSGTYTTKGITKLCEALKGSAVTSLDIGNNRIGDECASALAAILKETMISNLNVGYNNITGDAAENLATVVLEHASMTDFCGIPLTSLRENSITELNLGNKVVGLPGAIVLSKLLPSAVALTWLNLADNALCGVHHHGRFGNDPYTTRGITKLCEALKGSAVTSLNIAINDIGDEGASALAAVLKEMRISKLNVDGHFLPIDELRGTKPTEKIDLSRKDLGVASAIIIASCIQGNSVLKELDMGINRIGDEGASTLAAIIKETQITTLECATPPQIVRFCVNGR